MQIDEFVRYDQHNASIGIAFDPKGGGRHYRFICANDGEITRLDRLIGDEWISETDELSLRVLVRHCLAGGW